MSFQPTVTSNFQQLEYQKFVEINNDTTFPPVSVVRTGYEGVSAMDVYPKSAILVYTVNAVQLSATTTAIGAVTMKDGVTSALATVDAAGNIFVSTAPRNSTAWGGVSGLTSADGVSFTAFSNNICNVATFFNTTSATILIKGTAGSVFPVLPNTNVNLTPVASTNEILFKRLDESTVQLPVYSMFTRF